MIRGRNYREIPTNALGLRAGSVLLPTESLLTVFGSTSLDFVIEQGGSNETFIFLFGVSKELAPFNVIEGIFLNKDGPGFHPTWGVEQLILEVARGGWTVVSRELVKRDWAERIESRMNG